MKQTSGPKYSCCFDDVACMKFYTWLDGHYCYANGGKAVRDCSACRPAEAH